MTAAPTLDLVVIDHTDPGWAGRYSRKYARRGATNGAATYSREIVDHQVPVWGRFAPTGTVVATCGLLRSTTPRTPLAVQYLHTYPLDSPLAQVRKVTAALTGVAERIVFVTAYRSLHLQIRAAGHQPLYVPMTVDADTVREAAGQDMTTHNLPDRHSGPTAVYFGNITRDKRDEFQAVSEAFSAHGWQLDVITGGTFNGQRVTQAEAWAVASRYWCGVAVGRCALELAALGLRVLVSGAAFGGIATTPEEWGAQTATNFNGRVVTFDRDRAACIASFDHALVRPDSNPTQLGVDALRDGLIGLHARGWFE